jgi:hypothetical protein
MITGAKGSTNEHVILDHRANHSAFSINRSVAAAWALPREGSQINSQAGHSCLQASVCAAMGGGCPF